MELNNQSPEQFIDESIGTIVKALKIKSQFKKEVAKELNKYAKKWASQPGAQTNRELEATLKKLISKYNSDVSADTLHNIAMKMKDALKVVAFSGKNKSSLSWQWNSENTVASAMPMASASDGRSVAAGPRMKPDGTFAGVPYFKCSGDVFQKARLGRKKNQHWTTFLGAKDEFAIGVRQWSRKNKNPKFLLRHGDSFTYAQ